MSVSMGVSCSMACQVSAGGHARQHLHTPSLTREEMLGQPDRVCLEIKELKLGKGKFQFGY